MEFRDIKREHYLEFLRQSRDLPSVKILTGMRRCGKSTLLSMFMEELIASGVGRDDIFYFNTDASPEMEIDDYGKLMTLVRGSLAPSKGKYIFIDEVQNIDGWEKAVEAFRIAGADVYITGSNAQMFSSELETKLSGRAIELKVYPLAFSEYMMFRKAMGNDSTVERMFSDYVLYGGLPEVSMLFGGRERIIPSLISGTYGTIYEKDIVLRNGIRETKPLSEIMTYMMKNVGNRISANNITGYLASKGRPVSRTTVDSYIGHLAAASVFQRARRLEWKSKEYLATTDKYYATDVGMRNQITGHRPEDGSAMLENVVFMELMYRFDGEVSVCAVGNHEVDFVAGKGDRTEYYQATLSLNDPEVLERELRPLRKIGDSYPKTVVTMDRYFTSDIDGIRIKNVIDFLTEAQRMMHTIACEQMPSQSTSEGQALHSDKGE